MERNNRQLQISVDISHFVYSSYRRPVAITLLVLRGEGCRKDSENTSLILPWKTYAEYEVDYEQGIMVNKGRSIELRKP